MQPPALNTGTSKLAIQDDTEILAQRVVGVQPYVARAFRADVPSKRIRRGMYKTPKRCVGARGTTQDDIQSAPAPVHLMHAMLLNVCFVEIESQMGQHQLIYPQSWHIHVEGHRRYTMTQSPLHNWSLRAISLLLSAPRYKVCAELCVPFRKMEAMHSKNGGGDSVGCTFLP